MFAFPNLQYTLEASPPSRASIVAPNYFTPDFQPQDNLTATITTNKMCRGTLTLASCGHYQKFHPLQYCDGYSPKHRRCNGTVSVLHTIDSPSFCIRCATRIEANIIRERDLVTAELGKYIAEIDQGLCVERNHPFNYVTLIFERARLRETLKGFWEEREKELLELREMQGMARWDRVADLRDDTRRRFQALSD